MPGLFAPFFAATAGDVTRWVLAGLGVILLFGLSIFVHEGGHFAAAKWLGLRADVFSIGFGPALWKKRRGGTEYRISAFPFGGYVALPQLDPAGMARLQGGADGSGAGGEESGPDAETPPPAVWWKRLVVAVAGPACNLAFAVPLALLVRALPPVENPAISFGGAVIGAVAPESDAARAGLRPGDMVLRVADRPVAAWSDLVQEVHLCSEDGFATLSVSNIIDGEVHPIRVPVTRDSAVAVGTWRIAGISSAEACGAGHVIPGSAAARAGVAENDVLLSVGGRRGVSPESFGSLLAREAETSPDGRIALSVLRGRDVLQLTADAAFDAAFDADDPQFAPGVRIVSTLEGLPAAQAGLQAGDRIDSVGGVAAETAAQVVSEIRRSECAPLEIRFTRFGPGGEAQTMAATVTPVLRDGDDGEGERPMIGASLGGLSGPGAESVGRLIGFGIVPASVQSYVPPWSRHRAPLAQLRGDAAAVWRVFGPLFGHRHKGELGKIATSLGGPVIILSSLWTWLLASFAAAMGFIRFLNVNLAIVNLLPIPVLDGGHVVFALWRGVFGREIPPRVVNALVNAFGVLIIALFALLTGCDFLRLALRFGS